MRTRTEHDSMGDLQVPADALYAAQTQRAVENFPVSGVPMDPAVLVALARIKAAAARTNADLGVLAADVSDAVAEAADAVADDLAAGRLLDQFPVDVYQTGSGTSTNMNVNEVVATLAGRRLGRPVHANDEVNASQSSNDTVPTAVHLAVAGAIATDLRPALDLLAGHLAERAEALAGVVKAGRTHLMDATPVTLGQELHGYATQVRRGAGRLDGALPAVLEVPLGGTAVGTGINTPPGFTDGVLRRLAGATGLPVTRARDHFEAQGARDALVEVSGQLRVVAVSLTKISNDLRWMGSGPNTGLAEIRLPQLQPGSSIMPGKVNPVVPEAVLQVCARVVGNDATVAWAGASGTFELNVMVPVMAHALLESVRLLAAGCRLLAERCVAGLEADVDRCRALAESSPSVVTPLARVVGYERAAEVAAHAVRERTTVREAALALGVAGGDGPLTVADLDRLLDVTAMTGTASP